MAGAADPWAALADGGWLDILLEDERGMGFLGLMAEALGAAGVAVPLVGTAVVWPTLFGGSAGGRRIGVAETGDGPGDGSILCEDGVGADAVVVLRDDKAGIHETFSVEAVVGGLEGDGLARLRLEGRAADRCKDAELVAEARRRAAAIAAAEMAGAIDRIAGMTAGYVTERQQFGRSISAFQVVAHGAARLATLAQAATWSARLACTSTDHVRHGGGQRLDLGGLGRGRRPGPSTARGDRVHRGVRPAAAVEAAAHPPLRLRRRPVPPPGSRPAGLMDYGDLLAGRRSTRRFDTGRDVPDAVLERVLAAPLAMPHAGNTYDWRGVVLRRRERDAASWPAVYAALLEQSYVEEAAVVVAFAVQPSWWAQRYRANVSALVERGLLDPDRHPGLLAMVDTGPGEAVDLTTGLIGEAMMGVAAAMLAALDAGLGATVTACRPTGLSAALGLPDGAVLCPWGVLALGWPLVDAEGEARPAAPKPALEEMYFSGRWDRPRAAPVV